MSKRLLQTELRLSIDACLFQVLDRNKTLSRFIKKKRPFTGFQYKESLLQVFYLQPFSVGKRPTGFLSTGELQLIFYGNFPGPQYRKDFLQVFLKGKELFQVFCRDYNLSRSSTERMSLTEDLNMVFYRTKSFQRKRSYTSLLQTNDLLQCFYRENTLSSTNSRPLTDFL